jgi:MFS family permease
MRMTLLVMPPVIPQLHDELHMSETQVGLLIGLPLAMLAVAAIPGSLLIARVGATLAVTLGMTIAALGGAARAAAIDVWTLYAAAIVSGFGIAIMQPGMPTLVREWLPSRLALGTIGYSSGMLMGAMFPAVFTIAIILPAVGGSWRLDVVLWAIPALLIAPVFLLVSPKIPEDVDKQAAGGAADGGRSGKILWSGCSALLLRATTAPISSPAPFSETIWRRLASRNCSARRSAGSTVRSLWRWRYCFSPPIASRCAPGRFWSSARQCSRHFW